VIPLGILAAAGGAVASAGSYDLLATEILTSSQASIEFTSLGSYATDYQHLQIRGIVRGSTTTDMAIQFNDSTTGGHYVAHKLSGDGSSVTSSASTGRGEGIIGRNGSTANVFSPFITDILDFSSSDKLTTIRSLAAQESSQVGLFSSLWVHSTDAVTKIKIFSFGTMQIGTRFSLYGIRKAA
jgi:hypothetical protein